MSGVSRSSAATAASRRRPRVLFVGEGCTLAHAARVLALSAALPVDRYEAVLATPDSYAHWAPASVDWLSLPTQSPQTFAERLRAGRPVFSTARLQEYFRHDLELIDSVAPDLIVGDFRLSLAASARKAGVPYISLSNAYWSPDRPMRPVRPTLDRFNGWPPIMAEAAFRLLAPAGFRWHAKPVDRLMAVHGLDGISMDVRRAFTEADLTLYADIPGLFPDLAETEQRRFLGPVSWEPPVAPPAWWDDIPGGAPVAYVTLGSSGEASRLGELAGWLADMGFVVLAATAGRASPPVEASKTFLAEYLPGTAAAARSDIVVCNGGSPTATQALMSGRPVLGLCSNMDQFLNMQAVQARGAGIGLRADRLTRPGFTTAVGRLLEVASFQLAAARLAEGAAAIEPARVLADAIDRMTDPI